MARRMPDRRISVHLSEGSSIEVDPRLRLPPTQQTIAEQLIDAASIVQMLPGLRHNRDSDAERLSPGHELEGVLCGHRNLRESSEGF
jgi:hypothetical protein